MSKVVYNACYGGFSLSRAAVLRGRELSGDPAWGGPCLIGDKYPSGKAVEQEFGGGRDLKRTDPVLAHVVEELCDDASGPMAHLKVAEIPAGTRYRIDEYDGYEAVMTVDDYEWETAK